MAFCGSEGRFLQKALTVATMVVVIGAVAFGADFWRDWKFAAGLARGIVNGLILGSNVWSNVWPHHRCAQERSDHPSRYAPASIAPGCLARKIGRGAAA